MIAISDEPMIRAIVYRLWQEAVCPSRHDLLLRSHLLATVYSRLRDRALRSRRFRSRKEKVTISRIFSQREIYNILISHRFLIALHPVIRYRALAVFEWSVRSERSDITGTSIKIRGVTESENRNSPFRLRPPRTLSPTTVTNRALYYYRWHEIVNTERRSRSHARLISETVSPIRAPAF